MKHGKQLGVPLQTKMVTMFMLNICRESQGRIHSFKLSCENIKHLPCDGVYYYEFQCKKGKVLAY